MPLESFERRGLLVKTEVTENTDSTPLAAADGILLLNGSSKLEADVIERAIDRPYFGGDPFVLTKFRGSIEGDIELIGAAVAGTASPLSTVLRMGGMAETLDAVGPPAFARYNPVSTGIISATSYFFHAGTLKKLTGSRAAISGVKLAIGDYPKARIQIVGNATDVEETALPSIALANFQTPIPATTETMTLTVGGFAVSGTEFTLDFGSELGLVEHTEARLSRISDRKPTFTTTFYRPAKADLDVHALWRTHSLVPIVALVDGGAARLTRVTVGFGQIESIEEVEIEKDYGYKLTGRCVPFAGNDEFLIEFE